MFFLEELDIFQNWKKDNNFAVEWVKQGNLSLRWLYPQKLLLQKKRKTFRSWKYCKFAEEIVFSLKKRFFLPKGICNKFGRWKINRWWPPVLFLSSWNHSSLLSTGMFKMTNQSMMYYNKTAGYHWHSFRLPILVKMLFKKMKAFFLRYSPSYFVISPTLKVSILSPKKLTIQVKRHFYEVKSFNTHSTATSSSLKILKKNQIFFRKSLCIFKEIRTIFFYFLRNDATSVASCGKFSKKSTTALRYFRSTVGENSL